MRSQSENVRATLQPRTVSLNTHTSAPAIRLNCTGSNSTGVSKAILFSFHSRRTRGVKSSGWAGEKKSSISAGILRYGFESRTGTFLCFVFTLFLTSKPSEIIRAGGREFLQNKKSPKGEMHTAHNTPRKRTDESSWAIITIVTLHPALVPAVNSEPMSTPSAKWWQLYVRATNHHNQSQTCCTGHDCQVYGNTIDSRPGSKPPTKSIY